MQQQLISDAHRGKLGDIRPALGIISVSSATFSFQGYTVEAVTLPEFALGLMFAMATGTAIYVVWGMILKTVPFQRTAKGIAKSLLLTLAWCVIAICLSSVLNVAGMRGADAMEMHLSNYVEKAETTLNARIEASLLIEGISSDLRLETARYTAAAESEFKSGAYTGAPGSGGVMYALQGVADRLADFAPEIAAYEDKAKAGRANARTKLDRMRRIATEDKPLKERLRAMANMSNTFQQDLAQLDHRQLAEALQRVLAGLPRIVDNHSQLSPNPTLANRQRAALARVRQDIVQTNLALSSFIDDALAQDTAALETLEDITPYKAVLAYWDHYLPFWVAGIGLDLLPFILVLFLLQSISSKSQATLAIERITQISLADYMRALMAQDALRRTGMDPKAIQDTLDALQGTQGLPKPPEDPKTPKDGGDPKAGDPA